MTTPKVVTYSNVEGPSLTPGFLQRAIDRIRERVGKPMVIQPTLLDPVPPPEHIITTGVKAYPDSENRALIERALAAEAVYPPPKETR